RPLAFPLFRRPFPERSLRMWFTSWLRNPTRSGPGKRLPTYSCPRRRATFRPRVEALEERWLPSQIPLTVNTLIDTPPKTPPAAGTLRAAILAADGDANKQSDQFKIDFSVTGTIDLQSPLPDLNANIAIQGPGASSLTVERPKNATFTSAIVTVDLGQTASLAGLTIANGNAGGIGNNGTLSMSGCTVSGNSAGQGGGIANNATLTVSGCTISGNSAVELGLGGGIFNSGDLAVSDSLLKGNTASLGGGIANGIF